MLNAMLPFLFSLGVIAVICIVVQLIEGLAGLISFAKWFWCWLRDHPYPRKDNSEAYRDWLEGREPFAPDVYCSNCGSNLSWHGRRGMGS